MSDARRWMRRGTTAAAMGGVVLAGLPSVGFAQTGQNGAPYPPAEGKSCRHWTEIAAETGPKPRRTATVPQPSAAELKASMLKVHNDLRRPLGVPDLTWDETLARGAEAWAKTVVATAKTADDFNRHDPNLQAEAHGENMVGGPGDERWTVEELAGRWIAERENFVNKPAKPSPEPGYNLCWGSGHYQGMIRWVTYRVGCGVATAPGDKGRTLVCRYAGGSVPAGQEDWPYPAGPTDAWPPRPADVDVASAASSAGSTTAPTPSVEFSTAILDVNNAFLKGIGKPALTWSATLAGATQARVDKIIAADDPSSVFDEADEYRGTSEGRTPDRKSVV